jgi:hypothetical protein
VHDAHVFRNSERNEGCQRSRKLFERGPLGSRSIRFCSCRAGSSRAHVRSHLLPCMIPQRPIKSPDAYPGPCRRATMDSRYLSLVLRVKRGDSPMTRGVGHDVPSPFLPNPKDLVSRTTRELGPNYMEWHGELSRAVDQNQEHRWG